MKLCRNLSFLAFGLAAAGLTAAQGCGSSDSGGAAATAAGRTPPGPPVGAATSNTPARTFALNQLFLGETDRTNPAKVVKDAWKNYGFDIDKRITAKDSTDVRQRQPGADSSKQEDGNEGIDNAFGRTVLGYILGIVPNPSKTINDAIQGGSFTILLTVNGLTDDPKQTNLGLGGDIRVGGAYGDGKKPTFAPDDDWPYRADPAPIPFSGSYVTNGTFVNGENGTTVELSLLIQGVQLVLTINRAVITFDHTAPNDITNGTISGVIATEALVSGVEKIAGRLTATLCGGSTLETVKQTIRQASDILSDGSNVAGVPCDAISIGLGFTGKKIGDPKTIAAEVPPSPDPCADAGATPTVDAGTDSGSDAGDAGDAGGDAG